MHQKLKLLFLTIVVFTVASRAQTADFVFSRACVHDTVYFYNTSLSQDSIIAANWDFDADGQFDDDQGDTVYRIFGAAGLQNVGLRIVTENGSAKAIYKGIDMGFRPEAAFSYDNTCMGAITYFDNESTVEDGAIDEFKWFFGDGETDLVNFSTQHFYEEVNQYTVSLKVATSEFCSDSVAKKIIIANKPEKPAIIYSGDTTFQTGDSLRMTVVGSFDKILWSTGDTAESILVRNPGIYKVTVANGTCTNSRSVRITVLNSPEINKNKIQNVITPNSDGYNDRWEISLLDNYRPCAVNVINKRGNTVFQPATTTTTGKALLMEILCRREHIIM